MAEKGPRVFYLRDERQFPVACIASDRQNHDGHDQVVFAMSMFNPRDEFDRSRARAVAEGRLKKGKVYGSVLMSEGQIKRDILKMLADPDRCPIKRPEARDKVVRAAKLWLRTHKDELREKGSGD